VPLRFRTENKCKSQVSLFVDFTVKAADARDDDLGRMPGVHKLIFLLGLFICTGVVGWFVTCIF